MLSQQELGKLIDEDKKTLQSWEADQLTPMPAVCALFEAILDGAPQSPVTACKMGGRRRLSRRSSYRLHSGEGVCRRATSPNGRGAVGPT